MKLGNLKIGKPKQNEKLGKLNTSKDFYCTLHGKKFTWKERCFTCKRLETTRVIL